MAKLRPPDFYVHDAGVVRTKGSDAWFQLPIEDLLPESYRSQAGDYNKGLDTMDVWFDSGTLDIHTDLQANFVISCSPSPPYR